jgi:insertion element IS1 protein InsB
MAYKKIDCPHCFSEQVVKNGKTQNKKQKYLCKSCSKQFITDYSYNGCKSWVQELIVPMTLNSSGIRDISRVLGISTNTVLKTIRREAENLQDVTSKHHIIDAVEIDEQWSYVSHKKNQQWLWYAWDRNNKKVLHHVVGKRTDHNCLELLKGLKSFHIKKFYTDNWQSYSKFITNSKHVISKKETQNIERNNLNFRTHLKRLNRKTICFSKSQNMHENVINLYVKYGNTS